MPKMVCFGGEKDGLGMNGELTVSASERPDVFYAVPNLDEDTIKKVRGNTAKQQLREKLSILAYKYDPDVSTAARYVMRRCPELDRVSPG